MTSSEANKLVNQYYRAEGYQPPGGFEHRFDPDSSALMYSLIRRYQPMSVLAIGTWLGGSTCHIMAALLKNNNPFTYVASELLDNMRESTEKNCKEKHGIAPTMIGDITKNLDKVPKKIDFLFIDTDHDVAVTEFIVKNIFPRVKKGALIAIHDFAIEEVGDKWVGKGENGIGGLPETQYYMDMYHKGEWPFKKIYFMYKNPYYEECRKDWEAAFWQKE